MILLVDAMAERYSMLPSQILREATTIDLVYFDTAFSWRNFQAEKNKNKGSIPKGSVRQEDLQRRMEQVRKK